MPERIGIYWWKIGVYIWIWGIAFAFLLPLILVVGPRVESAFFPVLTYEEPINVYRRGNHLIWTYPFRKNRSGAPVYFAFTIAGQDPQNRFVAFVKRGEDCKELITTARRVQPLASLQTTLCAEIPEPLRSVPELTVFGSGEYTSSHSLWTLDQPLPPVNWQAGRDPWHDPAGPPVPDSSERP